MLTAGAEPWSAEQALLNISVAFVLGLFVSFVYRATHRKGFATFSFVNTQVLVSMIMCLVIMVIGNNIARAFGLAGAMSIIRFRTAVKDTRDTAFVFFALGAGMASGTGNLDIAVAGTALIGLFIGVLHWTRYGARSEDQFVLTFDMYAVATEEERHVYRPAFDRFLRRWDLTNLRSVRVGEFTRHTFQVVLNDPAETYALVSELSGLEGLQRVSLTPGDKAEA
jgi:uncharacterized membrane protein YhiD involved in acid resistance